MVGYFEDAEPAAFSVHCSVRLQSEWEDREYLCADHRWANIWICMKKKKKKTRLKERGWSRVIKDNFSNNYPPCGTTIMSMQNFREKGKNHRNVII